MEFAHSQDSQMESGWSFFSCHDKFKSESHYLLVCNEHGRRSSWLFTKEAEKPILVFGKNIPTVKFIFQNTRVYIAGSRPKEQPLNS